MNTLMQDVVYGVRILRKKPVFTAIAALSLALGIGVNTAIFTLVNTILLGSLPYPEPNRVVAIWAVPPQHRSTGRGDGPGFHGMEGAEPVV
jgi:putative ABC transport system permease protein